MTGRLVRESFHAGKALGLWGGEVVARTGMADGPRGSGVQSVERALDILEFLSRSEDELGVSEIGEATGLAAGTVHRLLGTLADRGYVHKNTSTRRYGLGLKSLTMAITTRERLAPLALPFLEELMQVSNESANLAILEGNTMMYIEQVSPPSRMLRSFTEPGNRVPLHSSGTGKVLLAYQPPRLIDFIVGRAGLTRQTAATITDPGQLRSELRNIRREGYAVDHEEQEEGVRCLAAPVFGPDGDIFASISLSGPASRLTRRRIEGLVPDLKRIAADLSRALETF
ncbi:MAG: IclR family transcriptional regulator [Actinomycetota bacterium]|nr:IclR family transcriptional regulator [Actinomycetota bacterium]